MGERFSLEVREPQIDAGREIKGYIWRQVEYEGPGGLQVEVA